MFGFISHWQGIYWRVYPLMKRLHNPSHTSTVPFTRYMLLYSYLVPKNRLHVQRVRVSNANRTHWRFSTQTCTPWFITHCVRRLSNKDSTRWRHYKRLREKDNIQRKEIYSVTWHKQTIIHSLRHWDWYQRYKMKSDYYWLIVYHHTRLRWLISKIWLSHLPYAELTLSWLTLFK